MPPLFLPSSIGGSGIYMPSRPDPLFSRTSPTLPTEAANFPSSPGYSIDDPTQLTDMG